MSRLHWKRSIDDVQNQGCSPEIQERLLDAFEHSMAKTATTLARKAWFDLTDFHDAKPRGIDGFQLTLTRFSRSPDRDVWTGIFENGLARLEIMGSLERD